jgi:hypothetical protein
VRFAVLTISLWPNISVRFIASLGRESNLFVAILDPFQTLSVAQTIVHQPFSLDQSLSSNPIHSSIIADPIAMPSLRP